MGIILGGGIKDFNFNFRFIIFWFMEFIKWDINWCEDDLIF